MMSRSNWARIISHQPMNAQWMYTWKDKIIYLSQGLKIFATSLSSFRWDEWVSERERDWLVHGSQQIAQNVDDDKNALHMNLSPHFITPSTKHQQDLWFIPVRNIIWMIFLFSVRFCTYLDIPQRARKLATSSPLKTLPSWYKI